MAEETRCPICQSPAHMDYDANTDMSSGDCDVCGKYYMDGSLWSNNHLAPFLFHNHSLPHDTPKRRYTTLAQGFCAQANEEFERTKNPTRLVHVDASTLQDWYPETFAQRVDLILMRLNELADHIGQSVSLSIQALQSLLFIDRNEPAIDGSWQATPRRYDAILKEVDYMLVVLQEQKLIRVTYNSNIKKEICLLPAGYARVDSLLKNDATNKNVFVAMQFGNETKELREKIREGINAAGYSDVFIDEVPHNNLITPEILKRIRESKFVVSELTHGNQGAYFEAGYATGLGKQVIQLCKEGVKIHFDLAQKNTIFWNDEAEIPERLEKRIQATIE